MRRPVIQLILIQFKEFYREPGILFWAVAFPILMSWGLGIAFTHKLEQKRDIAFIENTAHPDTLFRKLLFTYAKKKISDKGQNTYIIRTGTNETGFTVFRIFTSSWENSIKSLKRGTILIILEEKEGKLTYHYDPLNTEAQLSYMQLSLIFTNNKLPVSSAEVKPLKQTGTRYIDFLIPGMIAMNLMMSTMWGTSYSLIEKRSKKLLRRMVATPMRKSSFLIAQLVARLALNIIEAVILFVFAYYYFNFTLEGSFFALLMQYFAGMFCFTGIAFLVSSRTANTYVGNGLINAVVTPMAVLSGIFFSYHNFPDFVLPFIKILPLTMLADGLRSIFIEGAGIMDVFVSTIMLSFMGVITFITALKIFKWY